MGERTMKVMKFGGSSVAERFPEVLRIAQASGPGTSLVVSALGDSTDVLLAIIEEAAAGRRDHALARLGALIDRSVKVATDALGTEHETDLRQLVERTTAELPRLLAGIAALEECSKSTADRVLSFGERVAASLVAFGLRTRGRSAEMVDSGTWTVTDDTFGSANVLWDETSARARSLPRDPETVYVHTGFLGRTGDGCPTTLGRNGSDYTATLLARALSASEITIWTDVPGVMTGDPSLVDEAYPVPHLSYRETLELGGLGLRILHPRTIVPLLESGIPLRIRSTLDPAAEGTRIDAAGGTARDRPTCVTSLEEMVLYELEGTHRSEGIGIAPRALSALAEAGVDVWFASQAPRGNGIAILVARSQVERAHAALERAFAAELVRGALPKLRATEDVTLLTLVAEAMGQAPNVAGRFFGALGALGINVRAATQGATSRAISAVVSRADTPAAVRAVHAAFNLSREQVNILLLGVGTVGGQVLAQLGEQRQARLRDHDLDLRVFGVAGRTKAVHRTEGLDPATAAEALRSQGVPWNVDELLDALARLPVPILVDCTASEDMAPVYLAALRRGIHVVAANKKPLADTFAQYTNLRTAARKAHRAYRYETTVGASLPIVETLANLVRTGDRVRLVEGSFSGTLGYLANEVMAGVPLARAVARAKELGYTEPHPRDDLSGKDAARKALILAREVGLSVELDQVTVTPFVPESILAHDDLGDFFAALERADDAFADRIRGLKAEGRVLRYLARIDLTQQVPTLEVGPVGVPADHPATRLRGSEAFVAFTTERYAEYPLVVQGAGAGGAVTAAGVIADVLALSQGLRGR
ncbi:MAG: bifunctional aspartate kinase/homoserine dehydrogenase I [Polyangiaceae bacterium]|nr:bifunctional aspartate kinase/homoserine dehydrogenase I [Polyangiaceae bacterium]